MIRSLISVLMEKLFGRKTVSGVMSAFNKAAEELNVVERKHAEEAERQEKLMVEAHAAKVAAINEVVLAREVASKLNGIIATSITSAV